MRGKTRVLNFNCDSELTRIIERERRRIKKSDPTHSPCRTKAIRSLLKLGDTVRAEQEQAARDLRVAAEQSKPEQPQATEQRDAMS